MSLSWVSVTCTQSVLAHLGKWEILKGEQSTWDWPWKMARILQSEQDTRASTNEGWKEGKSRTVARKDALRVWWKMKLRGRNCGITVESGNRGCKDISSWSLQCCGRLHNEPQRCPHPKPQQPVNVTSHGKWDFEYEIKIRIPRRRNYSGLSGRAQYDHKGPYKRKVEGSEWKEKMGVWKLNQSVKEVRRLLLALRMKEGVVSRKMQADSRSWKRQGNRFSLELPESGQACRHLDISPVKPNSVFWAPEL